MTEQNTYASEPWGMPPLELFSEWASHSNSCTLPVAQWLMVNKNHIAFGHSLTCNVRCAKTTWLMSPGRPTHSWSPIGGGAQSAQYSVCDGVSLPLLQWSKCVHIIQSGSILLASTMQLGLHVLHPVLRAQGKLHLHWNGNAMIKCWQTAYPIHCLYSHKAWEWMLSHVGHVH